MKGGICHTCTACRPVRVCCLVRMADINERVCQRLLQLSKGLQLMFKTYSTDGKHVTWDGCERLGRDFGIIPSLCAPSQLRELFDVRYAVLCSLFFVLGASSVHVVLVFD